MKTRGWCEAYGTWLATNKFIGDLDRPFSIAETRRIAHLFVGNEGRGLSMRLIEFLMLLDT